jgi:hypothetical protein
MLLLSGLLMLAVTAAAYAYPRLRFVEDELPDVLPSTPEQDEPASDQSEPSPTRQATASPA